MEIKVDGIKTVTPERTTVVVNDEDYIVPTHLLSSHLKADGNNLNTFEDTILQLLLLNINVAIQYETTQITKIIQ